MSELDIERERARHKTGAKQEQPYILCVPTGDESFGDGNGDGDDDGNDDDGNGNS